jgi:hypothetical protein
MFQTIVDNRVVMEFNTAKKRDAFIKMLAKIPNHKITWVSTVCYPWNIENGMHNLKSPEDFAKLINCSVEKVLRAIKNGFLQTERLGNNAYIVDNQGTYVVKGVPYTIDNGSLS